MRSGSPAGALRTLLAAARIAAGLLAVLWLPPAVYMGASTHRVGGEVVAVLGAAVAWNVLAIVAERVCRGHRQSSWRWPLALAIVLGVLVLHGELLVRARGDFRIGAGHHWLANLGNHSGGGGSGGVTFRGQRERSRSPDAVVIALVGCSMIFGVGLDDADAPDRALERALRRRGVNAEVHNFGWFPVDVGGLTTLASYAANVLSPDLVVLYLPGHHTAVREGVGQVDRLHEDFFYRLYVATHYPPLVAARELTDLARESDFHADRRSLFEVLFPDSYGAARRWLVSIVEVRRSPPAPARPKTDRPEVLAFLDELARVAASRRLLLVTDTADGAHFGGWIGRTTAADLALREALGARPELDAVSVSDDPAWQQAPTRPDGHWTAEGARIVAERLADLIAERLRAPRRATGSTPGAGLTPPAE